MCLVKGGEVSSSAHRLGVCATVQLKVVGVGSMSTLFQMFARVICPPEEKFTLGQRGWQR